MADRGEFEETRPVQKAAPRRPRLSWRTLAAIALMVALIAVAVIQARQFALLSRALQPGDDLGLVSIFRAETDYVLLREQWRAATDERTPLDATALRQRFRGWADRIALLHTQTPRRLIGEPGRFESTLAQADHFVAAADPVLGAQPQTEPDRVFASALLPTLDALAPALHALSASAALQVATRADTRSLAVRRQNLLGLGLTVFLSLLTLAFAALALRQLSQLRRRRQIFDRLSADLRRARKNAIAAGHAKTAFLANMSHEIRTPFQGLMGMLSLLRETGLNPRQTGYLRTATESADHLLALLGDILDLSQLEGGRLTLVPGALDLRGLLREVEALMRPRASAKQLALHVDIDPALPERVLADAPRVKQIICHLLDNAIKFSDRGAVVLDARVRRSSGHPASIEIRVTDNGIGMDEATVAQIFTRFMQGDSAASRRHGGSGLGLELSRRLARLMDGDIAVRSKPGEGSCFSFCLPAAAVPQDLAAAPVAAKAAPRALQVLVAEDHPVNRQYMAALLESMGHQAHFSANGQEALQAALGHRFDVVLMDLHMPVLDGIGATRAIRALPDPAISTLPIVALTADAFEETRERCLVAGMNDFLTKPVSPRDLSTSLRRLFGSDIVGGAKPTDPSSSDRATLKPGEGAAAREGAPPLIDERSVQMSMQGMPPARYHSLLTNFLDQGPDTVLRLRAAIRDAQPLELRVNAHAARGAALNLGLSALAATAEALHEGAARLPAHEVVRLVQRYEQQLAATRQAARTQQLLDEVPAAGLKP
ncbi:MAG: ATP-binding protein [Pseudomonadota bacterium]|nr:ATP-binding protein [Pseudomonadota bacterium]